MLGVFKKDYEMGDQQLLSFLRSTCEVSNNPFHIQNLETFLMYKEM